MDKELLELLASYPTTVEWSDVVDFVNFDTRLSAIDCLVINTIGVSKGFIEFTPNNNPPLQEEILCWIWGIRPDLSKALMKLDISEDFRILLNAYLSNNKQVFWNHITMTR